MRLCLQKAETVCRLFVFLRRLGVHIAQTLQTGASLFHLIPEVCRQLMDDRELGYKRMPRQGRLIGKATRLFHLRQSEVLADFAAQAVQPVFGALQGKAGAIPGGFDLNERLLHGPFFVFLLHLFRLKKAQLRLPRTEYALELGQLAAKRAFAGRGFVDLTAKAYGLLLQILQSVGLGLVLAVKLL